MRRKGNDQQSQEHGVLGRRVTRTQHMHWLARQGKPRTEASTRPVLHAQHCVPTRMHSPTRSTHMRTHPRPTHPPTPRPRPPHLETSMRHSSSAAAAASRIAAASAPPNQPGFQLPDWCHTCSCHCEYAWCVARTRARRAGHRYSV